MSNTAPHVYVAINEVMADLAQAGISKDRRNTQGSGYNFRGIDDVYNAIAPVISKHKLLILPRSTERSQADRESKSGGALYYTTVRTEFDLVSAVDGSKHTICTYGEAMDSSDKSTNKAMSAAYKYACFQAFCIPTEGDNDADASTPQPVPAKITDQQAAELSKYVVEGNETLKKAMDYYKAADINALNSAQAQLIISRIKGAK